MPLRTVICDDTYIDQLTALIKDEGERAKAQEALEWYLAREPVESLTAVAAENETVTVFMTSIELGNPGTLLVFFHFEGEAVCLREVHLSDLV